jgi:hypothetical protein
MARQSAGLTLDRGGRERLAGRDLAEARRVLRHRLQRAADGVPRERLIRRLGGRVRRGPAVHAGELHLRRHEIRALRHGGRLEAPHTTTSKACGCARERAQKPAHIPAPEGQPRSGRAARLRPAPRGPPATGRPGRPSSPCQIWGRAMADRGCRTRVTSKNSPGSTIKMSDRHLSVRCPDLRWFTERTARSSGVTGCPSKNARRSSTSSG